MFDGGVTRHVGVLRICVAVLREVTVLAYSQIPGADPRLPSSRRAITPKASVPLPEGIPNHAETVARYEHITGHQARNVEHYEAFARVRLDILMVRAARMMIAGGMLPPDSTMAQNNPICQLVAKMLGLPAPAGAVTSYVGKRGETTE
jgi:hypothetical protein